METEDLENRLEVLSVERVTAQIQFLARDGVEVLDERAGAVGKDLQEDPLLLRDL